MDRQLSRFLEVITRSGFRIYNPKHLSSKYVYAGTDLPIPDTVTNLIEKTRLHNFHNGQDFLKIEIKVVFKTDCKWTISELTPNQVTMPFTTKMGDKTYQGERKFLDDSMIETSYIAAKPTVVTFKRVK